MVDISDPENPVIVNRLDVSVFKHIPSPVPNIVVHDDLLYVCGGTRGLYIFDLEDPAEPNIITHYDPEEPEIVSQFDVRSTGLGSIWVEGRFLYTVERAGGAGFVGPNFGIIDISDISHPDEPLPIGECQLGDNELMFIDDPYTTVVTVIDDVIYLDGGRGAYIFNISDPEHPEFIRRWEYNGRIVDYYYIDGLSYLVGRFNPDNRINITTVLKI